jgi:hypothetical protein
MRLVVSGKIIEVGQIIIDTTTLSITSDAEGRLVLTSLGGGGGGPMALDDLTDVVIASPAAGDLLTFDPGSGLFTNLPAGSGSVDPLVQDVTTAAPGAAANKVKVYSRLRAGRGRLWALGENGIAEELQGSLARRHVEFYQWMAGATRPVGAGAGTITAPSGGIAYVSGAAGDTAFNASPLPDSHMPHVRLFITSSTNAARFEADSAHYDRGTSGTQQGGFYLNFVWTPQADAGALRVALGCTARSGDMAGNPGTVITDVTHGMLIKESGVTNFNFFACNGAGANVKTSLGVAPVLDTGDPYEWELFCPPGSDSVYYRLGRFVAGTELAAGSVNVLSSPGVPATTQGRIYAAMHGIGSGHRIALFRIYGERYY